MLDIIIISNAFNPYMRMITESAIRTCSRADETVYKFYVVEQNKNCIPYKKATTIFYDFKFNYNKCLNIGISKSSSPYVALCNNDLIFYKNWGVNILHALKRFESVSPSTYPFEGVKMGYKIQKEVLGWCIVAHRELLVNKLNYLDMPVAFWYSDNVYVHQLKQAKVKHALIGNSIVRHLESITLNKMPYDLRHHYMKKQAKLFEDYKHEFKYIKG